MEFVVVMWTPAYTGDPDHEDPMGRIDRPPSASVIIYDSEVEAQAALYRLLKSGWNPDHLALDIVAKHNLYANWEG